MRAFVDSIAQNSYGFYPWRACAGGLRYLYILAVHCFIDDLYTKQLWYIAISRTITVLCYALYKCPHGTTAVRIYNVHVYTYLILS